MAKENTGLIIDVEESPKKVSQWLLFSIQHVLAMLVACITVPLLTGLPVAVTLIAAGIGTIIYLCFTKFKSPVFLSSSFAYLAPMGSALGIGLLNAKTGDQNYLALIIGMIIVGIIYCVIGLIVKKTGTGWLNKLLPAIIVGPMIMVIGLSLSGSAINNLCNTAGSADGYNLIHIFCGLVALFVTAITSHYGKGMLKLIPFVIGMVAGYLAALIFTLIGWKACGNEYFHVINFTPFEDIFGAGKFSFASIFNYKVFVPNDPESFLFLRFDEISRFDWSKIGEVILVFAPVAFVTMCEHIGDHENLGNIIGRDLLNEEPGLTRTLCGDGTATAISGLLCGAANTTYGENVAVVGVTKIASSKVVFLAAGLSILFGFFTPFTAFLRTIPGCVTGGVSLILYGFIASSGVKMLIKEKVDFNNTKNIFIASTMLVAGIGGLTVAFAAGNSTIQITSMAVSMILGIVLNLVLKDGKKVVEDKKEEEPKEEVKSE